MYLSPYSDQEVAALLTYYLELKLNRVGPFSQVRLMDLDRCMMMLDQDERTVVFLYGMCDETGREAAELLGIHQTTVMRQYVNSFEKLCLLMNGINEQ